MIYAIRKKNFGTQVVLCVIKQKKLNHMNSLKQQLSKIIIALIIGAGMITFTSCEKTYPEPYPDGLPGKAYVAINYYEIEPDYIEHNNPDMPDYFQWSHYYRTYAGYYNLYYEIEYSDRYDSWVDCWEIDYEIWQYEGERGSYYEYGRNGRDVYFDIDLTPDGPYFYSDSKSAPAVEKPNPFELISKTKNEIVMQQKKDGYGLKVTFKKVEKRERKK